MKRWKKYMKSRKEEDGKQYVGKVKNGMRKCWEDFAGEYFFGH